jgi:hypothetical protein
MLPSVRNAFTNFTIPLEGYTRWMYIDILGLVSCAEGDLIDPLSLAVTLPWVMKGSNVPATKLQVVAEWNRVKALQAHRKEGGGSPTFRDSAELVLSDAGISILVDQRLDANDSYLTKSFPTFSDWPADAQLALHSMAWAMGPAFRPMFPKFSASVDKMDFAAAAGPPGNPVLDPSCRGQAWMEDATNPGLRVRNLDNRVLFANAAVVMKLKMDPDVLYWPKVLTLTPPAVPTNVA